MRCAPPPPKRGVKMFQLAQINLFTPERKSGGGHPLAIRCQLLAGSGLRGDRSCGAGLDLDADLVSADGHGEFQPGGGEAGGVSRGGARHRLPAPAQAQARRNPRGGAPAAAPSHPRDAFAKAVGAISAAPDRRGTVC